MKSAKFNLFLITICAHSLLLGDAAEQQTMLRNALKDCQVPNAENFPIKLSESANDAALSYVKKEGALQLNAAKLAQLTPEQAQFQAYYWASRLIAHSDIYEAEKNGQILLPIFTSIPMFALGSCHSWTAGSLLGVAAYAGQRAYGVLSGSDKAYIKKQLHTYALKLTAETLLSKNKMAVFEAGVAGLAASDYKSVEIVMERWTAWKLAKLVAKADGR